MISIFNQEQKYTLFNILFPKYRAKTVPCLVEFGHARAADSVSVHFSFKAFGYALRCVLYFQDSPCRRGFQ